MKYITFFFLPFILLIITSTNNALAQQPDINRILKQMTLEEKAALVVGAHAIPGENGLPKTADKVPGVAGRSYQLDRFHMPAVYFADGSSGLVMSPDNARDTSVKHFSTRFPSGTSLASSWDTGLIRRVGAAIGSEAKQYGVDILLAPAINIQRNPLGGRNYEYYSEDPLLTGKLASAMITGIQQNQVGATLKHFAGNNQETDRHHVNSVISQRALREIYLRGFEIAIREAHPWLVMSSYNKLNGIYTAENKALLEAVLRKEWKFKGFVISDWFGGKNDIRKLLAGNDLIMPGNIAQSQAIVDSVKAGKLSLAQLDRNVSRILNVFIKTGSFLKTKYNNKPDLAAHAALAREAATAGMVLLKNDGQALPVKKNKKIALFGSSGYVNNFIPGSDPRYQQSLADGFTNMGVTCTQSLSTFYKTHIAARKPGPANEPVVPGDIVDMQSQEADIAVIVISRGNKMGLDKNPDSDFNLSPSEKELIRSVSDKFRYYAKKTVVVISAGNIIETASWRDQADGILLAGQNGIESGNAIADILTGKVNPSGKLTATYPLKYQNVPSSQDFGAYNNAVYHEGIYVGYRYYSTFRVPVAYPFGFGLSYTGFRYDHLRISAPASNAPLNITFTITNNGAVAGKEIAQVYISAPKSSIDKPERELKAFTKTKLLKPGESQQITLQIKEADLASFQPGLSAWVTDKGNYIISVGANSTDTKLKGILQIKQTQMRKVDDILKPDQEFEDLKQKDF